MMNIRIKKVVTTSFAKNGSEESSYSSSFPQEKRLTGHSKVVKSKSFPSRSSSSPKTSFEESSRRIRARYLQRLGVTTPRQVGPGKPGKRILSSSGSSSSLVSCSSAGTCATALSCSPPTPTTIRISRASSSRPSVVLDKSPPTMPTNGTLDTPTHTLNDYDCEQEQETSQIEEQPIEEKEEEKLVVSSPTLGDDTLLTQAQSSTILLSTELLQSDPMIQVETDTKSMHEQDVIEASSTSAATTTTTTVRTSPTTEQDSTLCLPLEGTTTSTTIDNQNTPTTTVPLSKSKSAVCFKPDVVIHSIPHRTQYSKQDRYALWIPRLEIQENATRNSFEFAVENRDWRQAIEEKDMIYCNGKLFHPAHFLLPNADQCNLQRQFLKIMSVQLHHIR